MGIYRGDVLEYTATDADALLYQHWISWSAKYVLQRRSIFGTQSSKGHPSKSYKVPGRGQWTISNTRSTLARGLVPLRRVLPTYHGGRARVNSPSTSLSEIPTVLGYL